MSLSACNDLFFLSLTYSYAEVVIQSGPLLPTGTPLELFALGLLISGGPDHMIKSW